MKKSILTLLVLLVCAIHTSMAYEYFTIYFSDGTKSEAFYATDVDSICYSKLSLDSIAYDDWQVQEIYTCDSVYRYPLAQIDSLSFKDVDENKVAEDIARVSNMIDPLYLKCRTLSEIAQHIPAILNTEGVEDVWVDNQTLFIKIRYWGTITYTYPVGFSISNTSLSLSSIGIRKAAKETSGHSHIDYKVKACIFDQTYKNNDEEYRKIDPIIDAVSNQFDYMGIPCNIEDGNTSFFNGDIFKYDLVFLITHGEYDATKNLHWIYTCEEASTSNADNIFYDIEAWIKFFKKYHLLSSDLMSIGTLFEIRNGKPVVVHYVKVSNKYISSLKSKFNNYGKAMIFNVACQSLKGPGDKMELGLANAFVKKGAGCYLGYTDTNGIGPMGGEYFFYGLMNGMSAESAYNTIPNDWKRQVLLINGNTYKPELKIIPETSNELCITHPETLLAETNGQDVILRGQIAMINTQELVGNYKYGFCIAANPNMNDAQKDFIEGNFDRETLQMKWKKTIDKSSLQLNTTYYYCAYMNDGYSDCYGEIKSFTTKDDNVEAYYVWDEASLTATYYYDGMHESRGGIKISSGYSPLNRVMKVTFDSSFAKYAPVSTAKWFYRCNKLTEFENLQYLNTSKVTNMNMMFFNCSSLTSLDLSSFDTSNVTTMYDMFFGCTSLTSLNLNSFNTSNVTDMAGIFDDCSSLTSLDLSSFETSNVTNMCDMFFLCTSLTSLDLNNFNTSKVTNMCDMFYDCSSLTSLDLSCFDTSNVTDMSGMFHDCSSLTSLDLGCFNTSNVTKMSSMFFDCSSLTSLDLSCFDTSKVENMHTMFWGCSSLTSLDLSCFDTSNVTDMSDMFFLCTSLTSLDLNNFNTSKVTNMCDMFYYCSSLRTIYAGNWHYTHPLSDMFEGCNNLTGGKGTKIGKNLYGYDKNGNPLYYYCADDGTAAHIDGGKDNPGLFTAK